MKTEKTKEIIKKVRQVEIRTNRLVNEALAGHYHSAFKGAGMNFDTVREYVRGDELKRIDWNVTARAGTPYVKEFVEERELTIMLLVDLSGSGEFGSLDMSKREVMAEIASVLAFSAIKNNDKVGLIIFTGEIELYIPPHKGRSHVLRVVREVLFFEPKNNQTDIVGALEFLSRVTTRRAISFVISDFCFSENIEGQLSLLKHRLAVVNKRHDAIAVSVNDSREFELPDLGYLTLEDAETGEQIEINTSSSRVRDLYSNATSEERDKLVHMLRSIGVDLIELDTHEPYLPVLMKFFGAREKRR